MKIKICGMTNKADIMAVKRAKADYAGIVLFFPKSKRNQTVQSARELVASMRPELKSVAVVVSPSIEQIEQIKEIGFDCVQIHGSVDDAIWDTEGIELWKAFNVSDMEYLEKYRKIPAIKGYVFDAAEAGSGRPFDWNTLKGMPLKAMREEGRLVFLAGGLRPDNVGMAISELSELLDGVDVSSGVEADGGNCKSSEKMQAFIENARNCI